MSRVERASDHLRRFGDVEATGRFQDPPESDIGQARIIGEPRTGQVGNAGDLHEEVPFEMKD